MLTLYYAPGSSSMASHLALEEARAHFEARFVDEDSGEQHTEAYRQINPRGKVPALRLPDNTILVENVAIQTYVARTHPDAGLLPPDPQGEARALSLMAFFASAVHPSFSHFWRPGRFTNDASGEEGVKSKGLETFFAYCREMDDLLAGQEWFLGRFSVVDCYGFVFYGWGVRAGLPMRDLRRYTDHKDRMIARPAVKRVLERERVVVD